MRRRYREKIYECGNYLEANIYPVYSTASGSRRKKFRPTTEVQKRLNKTNAENKLIRIINANFTEDDIRFDGTYRDGFAPESDEQAARELRNFLKRVAYYRKKHSLPPLKYIAVTEKGKRSGRYHHHIIMNGGVDVNTLSRIWGRGYTTVRALQPDNTGFAALAKYMIKDPVASKKLWNSSKNLVHPQARTRDGRISNRAVMELARDTDNSREYEKYYAGYYLAEAHRLFNDVNGGVYIHARFYKKEADLLCRRKSQIMRT